MGYWKFTSVNNWFSMNLPENWAEYDDDEGTYAFFNTNKWSGNLRVTPNRWTNVNDEEVDKAADYIQSELQDNSDAKRISLGKWPTAFYIKEYDENLVSFWITGTKSILFLCSFAFDKPFQNTDWHNNELIIVAQVLSSIKIEL